MDQWLVGDQNWPLVWPHFMFPTITQWTFLSTQMHSFIPDFNWFYHIYREQNTVADNLANEGQMGNNGIESHVQNPTASHWKDLAGFWDGALKSGNSAGGCGAWIGGNNILIDGRPTWTKLVSWRGNLDERQSAINCEMAAAFVMVYIMKDSVVGAMDIQDFPLTITEAFLNDKHFKSA